MYYSRYLLILMNQLSGAPIVANPILAIPFVVAPIIMTIVSYLFTISGLVSR